MNTYETEIRFFIDNLDNRSVKMTEVIRHDNFSHTHVCTLCQCETRELAEAMVKNLENARDRARKKDIMYGAASGKAISEYLDSVIKDANEKLKTKLDTDGVVNTTEILNDIYGKLGLNLIPETSIGWD